MSHFNNASTAVCNELIVPSYMKPLELLSTKNGVLPAFLFAVLYYIFSINTDREYEYCLENGVLTIAVIRGKRRRKTAHTLMMQDMEVIAPNWHEAVAKYRKNGGTEKLKKFDYTSYDDNIPYYTMIVYENKEKIKLLLDLNDSMLEAVKRVYPQKVYMR